MFGKENKSFSAVLIIVIVALSIVCGVLGAAVHKANDQIAQLSNEKEELNTKVNQLGMKLYEIPMTEEEEKLYNENKALLLEIYPAGDKAVNIAKCVYIFHRVGEVPNGKIVHAEKKTAEIDPAEQGQYGLPYTVNYFAFTTEDGEAYYMYFSGNNINSFFRGEFGQGEECIFAFVY